MVIDFTPSKNSRFHCCSAKSKLRRHFTGNFLSGSRMLTLPGTAVQGTSKAQGETSFASGIDGKDPIG